MSDNRSKDCNISLQYKLNPNLDCLSYNSYFSNNFIKTHCIKWRTRRISLLALPRILTENSFILNIEISMATVCPIANGQAGAFGHITINIIALL